MGLFILRCFFVLMAAGLSAVFIQTGIQKHIFPADSESMGWFVFGGMMIFAIVVIGLDVFNKRKKLDAITAVYFGLIVGLFMTYVLNLALVPIWQYDLMNKLRDPIQLLLGLVVCYSCISLLIQTRNDFRFIIPYVEFAKQVKGLKPCILDTSVVIDGRIADVVETNIIDGKLIMPKFVIAELQAVADSSDRLRRGRGRRGLDILNRMRANHNIDMEIFDRELPEFADQAVDLKLIALAKHLQGKLITNDYNLNKIAKLQGVPVINFNDLANALKPVFLPGEHIQVRIIKAGEEPGQGVGYLEDGTMVVIEGGREFINENINVAVTSVLQTSAGRMVFGRHENMH